MARYPEIHPRCTFIVRCTCWGTQTQNAIAKIVDSLKKRCEGIWNPKCLIGNSSRMTRSAAASMSSWKPVLQFRADLFRVLILLVLFIITGVAVTLGASG
jgi:hypothetical protein